MIDHIKIKVRDFSVAVAFYNRLMPLLGFKPEKRTSATISARDFQVVEYSYPRLAFAITPPRQGLRNDNVHRRRPGSLHHLAFRVKSREGVDKLHWEVKAIGAVTVSPPREYSEYKPAGYYAPFSRISRASNTKLLPTANASNGAAQPLAQPDRSPAALSAG